MRTYLSAANGRALRLGGGGVVDARATRKVDRARLARRRVEQLLVLDVAVDGGVVEAAASAATNGRRSADASARPRKVTSVSAAWRLAAAPSSGPTTKPSDWKESERARSGAMSASPSASAIDASSGCTIVTTQPSTRLGARGRPPAARAQPAAAARARRRPARRAKGPAGSASPIHTQRPAAAASERRARRRRRSRRRASRAPRPTRRPAPTR